MKIPRERKTVLTDSIREYVAAEMSMEIGNLAAENLLDFMLKQLGPLIYNQAIGDARAVVMQQMERVEEEIYALEQPLDWSERR